MIRVVLALLLALAPGLAWGQSSSPSTIPNVTIAAGNLPPANGGTGLTVPFSTVLRGYMAGCVTSNDGGTPNTVIDIALCNATDDTYTVWMQAAAFTKNMNAAWASGTGNGCLDVGSTLGASTQYWLYEISGSGQTTDYLCSAQVFGTVTYPTNYSFKRAVGWIKTDGSNHIFAFFQDDETFYYGPTLLSKDIAPSANITTANRTLVALNAPTGVKVQAIIRALATASSWIISAPDMPDLAPTATFSTAPGYNMGTTGSPVTLQIYTDTSGEIGFRPNNATNAISGYTVGFIWNRGRLN